MPVSLSPSLSRSGRGRVRRCASFTLKKKDSSIELQALGDFLKHQLPAYLIPDQLFFASHFTYAANGKLDRAGLQKVALPLSQAQTSPQPAYNALQYQLLQIWIALLKIPGIGINDNFFELGGDSLNAVVLRYRIEKLIDWSVPLAVIYQNPTVKTLAQAMLVHKGEQHSSPLIEIQSGTTQTPFIFLHGDFHGGGFYCHQLARDMGADQPFYAIQPHGLPGRPLPDTIEEMADEYLALIRSAFPEGPYFLGGHCNGALLAFEIAQRLLVEGSKVGLLVMMDPTHAYVHHAAIAPEIQTQTAELSESTGIDLDKLSLESRHNTIMRCYVAICKSYVPKFYPGKLTLFMAKDNLEPQSIAKGWEKLALKAEAYVVAGGHVSMITVHVATLAKLLVECRDKVKWR